MICEFHQDKLIIISEDVIDSKYLEALFEDSVRVTKETNAVHQGFHVTDEQSVRITIKKETNDV